MRIKTKEIILIFITKQIKYFFREAYKFLKLFKSELG